MLRLRDPCCSLAALRIASRVAIAFQLVIAGIGMARAGTSMSSFVVQYTTETPSCDDACTETVFFIWIAKVVTGLFWLLVSFLAQYGIRYKEEGYLTPYCIYSLLYCVAGGSLWVYTMDEMMTTGVYNGLALVWILGVHVLLTFVFMVVVRGYQLQVRAATRTQPIRLEEQPV